MDGPHCVSPFICRWTLGLFLPLATVNNTAVNMGGQVSVRIPAFSFSGKVLSFKLLKTLSILPEVGQGGPGCCALMAETRWETSCPPEDAGSLWTVGGSRVEPPSQQVKRESRTSEGAHGGALRMDSNILAH